MPRVKFHDFSKGLYIVGGIEQTPPGFLRRARGSHAIRTPSLRSRLGSLLLQANIDSTPFHSLYRFQLTRYQASSTNLYKNGSLVSNLFNGNRLTFVSMPPMIGNQDYLFITGGGSMLKITPSGALQNWGVAAPVSPSMTATPTGSGVLTGNYLYVSIFKNSAGSRSNPPASQISPGVLAVTSSSMVQLNNIPISPDPQVTAREIYRTTSGGSAFFLLTTINDNTTTTYLDNQSDSSLGVGTGSQALSLQFDNNVPDPSFLDAWGPYAGYMWWTRSSTPGNQGRVYYSGSGGRAEAFASFLDITNTDDPCQKGVAWNGSNYVFSKKKLWQIIGTGPFEYREVFGVPGTVQPFTVVPTPYGIAYQAIDGVRLFTGNDAPLVGWDQIGPIFRGEVAENIGLFTGVVAAYARDEYFISDGISQTLGINLRDGTCRDFGFGVNAFYFEPDTGYLQAVVNSEVRALEAPGTQTDNGTPIRLEWEIGGKLADIVQVCMTQRVYVDINTNGQTLTPILVVSGGTVVLAPFQTTTRQVVEWSVNISTRFLTLRLVGSVTAQVELFGMEVDVYLTETIEREAAGPTYDLLQSLIKPR